MNFIQRHWRGEYQLTYSYWCLFVALGTTYHTVGTVFLNNLLANPEHYLYGMITYQFIGGVIIFPWQSIGLLRTAERHFREFGRPVVLHLVQASVLVAFVLVTSHFVGLIQNLKVEEVFNEYKTRPKPLNYTIELTANGKQIVLRGPLDFGIKKSVEQFLQAHAGVQSVVLESEGGQIYEGRGLALLFDKLKLDTYSFTYCQSSCTTAFIGGKNRYLGKDARLGFHQYGFDSTWLQPFQPFYDLIDEQNKDLELYRLKNISENFLRQVFDKPNHEIWYPDHELLLKSGVITSVID